MCDPDRKEPGWEPGEKPQEVGLMAGSRLGVGGSPAQNPCPGEVLQGGEQTCPGPGLSPPLHFGLESLNSSGVVCQVRPGADSSPRGMHTKDRKAGSEASQLPGPSLGTAGFSGGPGSRQGGVAMLSLPSVPQGWQPASPRPAPPWVPKEPQTQREGRSKLSPHLREPADPRAPGLAATASGQGAPHLLHTVGAQALSQACMEPDPRPASPPGPPQACGGCIVPIPLGFGMSLFTISVNLTQEHPAPRGLLGSKGEHGPGGREQPPAPYKACEVRSPTPGTGLSGPWDRVARWVVVGVPWVLAVLCLGPQPLFSPPFFRGAQGITAPPPKTAPPRSRTTQGSPPSRTRQDTTSPTSIVANPPCEISALMAGRLGSQSTPHPF